MELLELDAKLDIQHVPYKGAALAVADVVSGHLELMVGNLPGPYPLIMSGKLRGLAVTSIERSPQLPDVPTVAEQGVAGFDEDSARMTKPRDGPGIAQPSASCFAAR
jgi:tripartite-type tricarboxylate transporter receptor subunit TctC